MPGREPFQQPEAVIEVLRHLDGSGLSRLVFSGYTLAEIRRLPLGAGKLANVDVLIAGRYVASQHSGRGMLGSVNQRLHLLTNHYRLSDLVAVPACEVIPHADGSHTVSGVAPLMVLRRSPELTRLRLSESTQR